MTEDDEPPDVHRKRAENRDAKRPVHKDDKYDALIEAAWNAGWRCERGGNNHIKCYPPDGGRMVPVPSTPSGSRTFKNKRAEFRRGGLNV